MGTFPHENRLNVCFIFTIFDIFSSIYLVINEDVCWFTKWSQKTVNFLINNLNISDCDLQHIKVSGLLLSRECSLRWFIKRACSLSRLYFHPDTNSTLFDSTFFYFYIKYNISMFLMESENIIGGKCKNCDVPAHSPSTLDDKLCVWHISFFIIFYNMWWFVRTIKLRHGATSCELQEQTNTLRWILSSKLRSWSWV